MNLLDYNYKILVRNILKDGVSKRDRTGTGTISLFGQSIMHDMSEGFPLLTTKKMAYKSIFAELLWFMRGQTNIKKLHEMGCHIWDGDWHKSNRKDGDLGKIYGYQWRKGKDQLNSVIEHIRINPSSRRHVVSAWNFEDFDDMILPPCHYSFVFYSNERGSLSIEVNMRSGDVPLGVPFNIASYGALLTIVAKMTSHRPKFLKINITDAHIYKNQVKQIIKQIERRNKYKLPKLVLPELDYKNMSLDEILDNLDVNSFQIENYESHDKLTFPLSN